MHTAIFLGVIALGVIGLYWLANPRGKNPPTPHDSHYAKGFRRE